MVVGNLGGGHGGIGVVGEAATSIMLRFNLARDIMSGSYHDMDVI